MKFSLRIAQRYLFAENFWGILFIVFLVPLVLLLLGGVLLSWISPSLLQTLRRTFPRITRVVDQLKQVSAIHIITGIAVLGVAIGTAALILVLSVFNGFEDLITGMYSHFNPDVKITPVEGKTFAVDSTLKKDIWKLDGVATVSETLQEVAFFENVVSKKRRDSIYYDRMQDFGILKGVDENYSAVSSIDSMVRGGSYILQKDNTQFAVLGLGMWNKLAIRNIRQYKSQYENYPPINVYMPKRKRVGPFEQQFKRKTVQPAGAFMIQQDFDNQYVLTSIDFARELLGFDNEVSALEVRLKQDWSKEATIDEIKSIMGPEFEVKDRYQQEEAFLKLMKVEKWLSYAIVTLMLLMVALNLIGAQWMIVLEKQKDIAILKSMGTLDKTIRSIFLNQGLLLTSMGVVLGFILSLTIYAIQKSVGIVSIPGDFIVEAYPISMRFWDFIVVAITVLVIGLLASVPPAFRAKRVPALIREE